MIDFFIKLLEGLEQGGGGSGSILPLAVILWCLALYLVYLVTTKVFLPLCYFIQGIDVKKTTFWNSMNISALVFLLVSGVFFFYLILTLSDSIKRVNETNELLQEADGLIQTAIEREERTKEFMNKVDERRKASKELLNKIQETNKESEEYLKAAKELYEKAKERYLLGIKIEEEDLEVKKEAVKLLDEVKESPEKLEDKH